MIHTVRTSASGRPQLRILRNIFRRKLRAFLTIFGISIGVFALVVMGALAEKLTLLVDGGMQLLRGQGRRQRRRRCRRVSVPRRSR